MRQQPLPAAPVVDFEKFGPVEKKPLSRIKKISGANLHRNWVMIPHVTNHEDADITDLEAFRVKLNTENAKAGIKLTMLAFLVKASVAALKKFPEFNASLDGETLVYKNYYHIGFAADTPNGLVVPVIKDADKKGVLEIAVEMGELAKKAPSPSPAWAALAVRISPPSSMLPRLPSWACAVRPNVRSGTRHGANSCRA